MHAIPLIWSTTIFSDCISNTHTVIASLKALSVITKWALTVELLATMCQVGMANLMWEPLLWGSSLRCLERSSFVAS